MATAPKVVKNCIFRYLVSSFICLNSPMNPCYGLWFSQNCVFFKFKYLLLTYILGVYSTELFHITDLWEALMHQCIAAHIYACSTLLSMWNVHYRVLRWTLLQIALSIINFYQLLPADCQPHMSHFTLAWSIISKRQRQANLKYRSVQGELWKHVLHILLPTLM